MINGSDCFSVLQTVYLLNQGETNIIQIMYSSGIFVTLISNISMVAAMFKTSQFNIISTYLTLNLALSDISFQIFGTIPGLCLVVNRPS